MSFSDFNAHKKFGRFTVTIDCEENRADVWVGANADSGNCVNLAYVEAGVHTGEPEWDDILDAVYSSGLGEKMVAWAYSTDLY